jgi:low affinity Fe/Cu permease
MKTRSVTISGRCVTIKTSAGVVIAVSAALILFIQVSCTFAKEKKMNTSLPATIRALSLNDTKAIENLAITITTKNQGDIRALIGMIHDVNEDEDDHLKARMVLLSCGGIARPLMDSLTMDRPGDLIWDVKALCNLHEERTKAIVELLEKLLRDTRPVPPPELLGTVEEKPPEKRICDDAYLLLRKLFAYENDELQFMNERIFLNMEFTERDAEIARFQKTKTWKTLLNPEQTERE